MNWVSLLIAIQNMEPVTAVMATIMVIYFFYRGGVNLLPKFKKSKENKDIKEDKSLLCIHKGCINYSSLTVILERVMKKSDQIFRIRYQDTLYEQMNDAELLWDSTKDILKENFTKTFQENNPDLPKVDKLASLSCYGTMLDSTETDMLGLIRRWMRKNHFVEKNEIDYENYITEKTILLNKKMTRLIDERYDEDRILLSRDVLKKSIFKNAIPIITKDIHSFFLKVKSIAKVKAEDIKDIESEIVSI